MQEVEFLYAVLSLAANPVERAVEDALRALTRRVPCRYSYVEVVNERDTRAETFDRALGATDEQVEEIRRRTSHGLMAHARVSGRTLCVSSAVSDERFRTLDSVKQHEIGAVLCVPFDGFWTSGVVYLQAPTSGATFSTSDVRDAETLARQLGTIIELHHCEILPTSLGNELEGIKRQRVEEALRRADWNISAVHRETGLSRDHIRRIIRGNRDRQ